MKMFILLKILRCNCALYILVQINWNTEVFVAILKISFENCAISFINNNGNCTAFKKNFHYMNKPTLKENVSNFF